MAIWVINHILYLILRYYADQSNNCQLFHICMPMQVVTTLGIFIIFANGGVAPIKETRSSDFGESGDFTDTTEVILSD